jgi:hypothetical protein
MSAPPRSRFERRRVFAPAVLMIAALAATVFASAGPAPNASTGELLASRLPRVDFRGGPFIRHPRIVTITFAGDDAELVSRLERFGESITRTSWWRTVSGGFCAKPNDCIGKGGASRAVRLDETLPAEIHAVELSALLRRHAIAGRFGRLDAESALLVYLPRGAGLKDAFARYCGDGPRAYHRALRYDENVIAYAVMPRCADEAALTGTASHELLEMATGPDTSRPGFAFASHGAAVGFAAAGNEVMDPCGLITRDREVFADGFVVRRAWSNAAAALGHDPCVPAASDRPYVALMPERQAVRLINRGDSITVKLEAASDRPIEKWAVKAIDVTGWQQRDQFVDLALDRSEVAPGDSAALRITLRKVPSTRLVVGIESIVDSQSYLWPLEVVTR